MATAPLVSSSHPASSPVEAQTLGLWDAISIIIGIVVGAGIYETAPFILSSVGSTQAALALWGLGGLLSLVGALCYAELASTYPRTGGDYVFLTLAYGRAVGFLFGWAELSCIMTGSIGMMVYIFAHYAGRLWSLPADQLYLLASAAVIVLTLLNLLGIAVGKGAQNILTLAKVLGIAAILFAGLRYGDTGRLTAPQSPLAEPNYRLAMILILYTYGGWNDAAFVAAEQRHQRRNIPLALILGTLLVTAIYLLINVAYISVLGFEGASQSKEIAADVLARLAGVQGEQLMCVLVLVSSLGAANGMILTGSRIFATLGRDHPLFATLGKWHPRWRAPVRALAVQCLVTLLMILGVGTSTGHACIDRLLALFDSKALDWGARSGFQTLLDCTAPAFWFFFLLSGLSLFVLRWKDPERERPFRVPLYPVVPLIFCAVCGFMFYSAASYVGWLALFGLVPVLLGLPLFLVSQMMSRNGNGS